MSYTNEDINRNIAKRSNGHAIFYDRELHRVSMERARKTHLERLAGTLENITTPGLAMKASAYIDSLLDRSAVGSAARVTELKTMKKNGAVPTLTEGEKGFFGRIKRKARQVKDFFKPSELKLVEEALAPVARDIARFPERYPYSSLESAFKENDVRISTKLSVSIENSNYKVSKDRALNEKIAHLRSSSPEKKSVKQTNISRELISQKSRQMSKNS